MGAGRGAAAGDGLVRSAAAVERAAGMVVLVPDCRGAVEEGRVNRRIAPAVGEVRPGDYRERPVLPRVDRARRRLCAEAREIIEVGPVVVLVVVPTIGSPELRALEIGRAHV